MLSWRVRRQLAVLLVGAIPIIGLGFWLTTKILPEPTCFDSRKNQGEIAADCGGPCAPCELKDPRAIEIFWARVATVRANVYDVVAELRNPNEVLSSSGVEYEFTLFDELGPIAVRFGRTFIFPQEATHIIETAIHTSRRPTRVEFKILKVDWEVRQESKPSISVERRYYEVQEDNGRKESVVTASLFNRAIGDFKEVEVGFLLLDKEGNLLGVNKILVENFFSNSRRQIKSIWPQAISGDVASITVEPRINVFDPSIILKP